MGTKSVLTKYLQNHNIPLSKDYYIFGIRGAKTDSDGDLLPNKQTPNIFDDIIGFINIDICRTFIGTVDPGKKYTINPLNPNGCFHLNNGFWLCQRAVHMGNEAFNIFSKSKINPLYKSNGKIEGWRDSNKNFINDEKKIYTDATGVDIHAGSNNDNIDGWSAGCQVLRGNWQSQDWLEFKNTLYNSKQKIYLYFLLDYSEIEGMI